MISIGDLAALVTAVGIAIYVMGLVGLSLTIGFNFARRDFTTAWYAVSLLPRTVVAGQGVRLWLRMPIIITAILLPTAQMIGGGPLGNLLILFMAMATVMVTGFLLALAPASVPIPGRLSRILLGSIISGSLGTLLLANGASLVAQGAQAPETLLFSVAVDALEALGVPVEENPFAIGVILILFGGFLIGVPTAIVFKPPLPQVKLEISEESATALKNVCNPCCQGWLVAHSDGFWHLFLKGSRELHSIPDEKVLVVRTGGEVHTLLAKIVEAASSEEAPPEEDAKPDIGEDK